MIFKPTYTDKAPQPKGPYSQAFRAGPWLFCAGQIPFAPGGSQIVGEDIKTQTRQVFKNIQAILSSEGMSFQNVVRNLIFLSDMNDIFEFNKVYEIYFSAHKPARSCVQAGALPLAVKLEVETTAFKAE